MKKSVKKYPFPNFLDGLCHPLEFDRWLERKTLAHLRRDRKRGIKDATRESYKIAIYDAAHRLAQVELLVLLLEGNDRHAAHNESPQVEVGEVLDAGCCVLGEAEGCGDEHYGCGENQGGKRLFHFEVLLGVFVC